MCLGTILRAGALAAYVLLALQLDAAADPVTYNGTPLVTAVSQFGEIAPTAVNGNHFNAPEAEYWQFWATAGDSVTALVDRISTDFDPVLYIHEGLYAFTTDMGLTNGTNDLFQGTKLIDFADDTIDVPGPFGDPRIVFIAPTTGWYTASVGEFFSGPPPTDGMFDYSITVRGNTGSPDTKPVPEPTLLALLACGSFGVALSRRRKTA